MTESIEVLSFGHLDLRDCKIALHRTPSIKLADGLSLSIDKEKVDFQVALS